MTYQTTKPPPGVQVNRNSPLSQGLVAYWLLNEGNGLRANDLSGNGNTGTLINFEPFSTTQGWTGTDKGTGLKFNGTNSYVDCGNNPPLNITKAITIGVILRNSTTVASPTIPSEMEITTYHTHKHQFSLLKYIQNINIKGGMK